MNLTISSDKDCFVAVPVRCVAQPVLHIPLRDNVSELRHPPDDADSGGVVLLNTLQCREHSHSTWLVRLQTLNFKKVCVKIRF